jgi:hypothetical protein
MVKVLFVRKGIQILAHLTRKYQKSVIYNQDENRLKKGNGHTYHFR